MVETENKEKLRRRKQYILTIKQVNENKVDKKGVDIRVGGNKF